MRPQEKSLGELLRQAGKITSRQIQVALAEQKRTHEPIGKVLVRLGFVEDRDILQVMQGMMVLTFRVGEERFGLETFRVREVLKHVPFGERRRGPWEGDVTLRGASVPVLSLRGLLGLPPVPDPKGTWFIVLERKSRPFVIWVDHVREVARLKVDQIEPMPPHLLGKRAELFYCLGKIREELYSIMNPDKLVRDEELEGSASAEVLPPAGIPSGKSAQEGPR